MPFTQSRATLLGNSLSLPSRAWTAHSLVRHAAVSPSRRSLTGAPTASYWHATPTPTLHSPARAEIASLSAHDLVPRLSTYDSPPPPRPTPHPYATPVPLITPHMRSSLNPQPSLAALTSLRNVVRERVPPHCVERDAVVFQQEELEERSIGVVARPPRLPRAPPTSEQMSQYTPLSKRAMKSLKRMQR